MSNERHELNKNLAQMLKGGVIMDVTTPEQARIARSSCVNGSRKSSFRYQKTGRSCKNERP